MAFYTTERLRTTARTTTASAGSELTTRARRQTASSFDIFLSHSFSDAQLILGIVRELEAAGKSVYVDWIEDAEVDRTRVTAETATLLRERLRMCASLIYAATSNSTTSRWMPWELGYFDGLRQDKVSVLPIVEPGEDVFRGNEFLLLYPFLELDTAGRPTVQWRADRRLAGLISFASLSPNQYRRY